jgi:hypothetical protein
MEAFMADLGLTTDQLTQVVSEHLKQNFDFVLITSQDSPWALVGTTKKTFNDSAVQITNLKQQLKELGFDGHYGKLGRDLHDGVFGRFDREPKDGVGVSTGFVARSSESWSEIRVDKDNVRKFVEATGVDFPGKGVVFPDLVTKKATRVDEKALIDGFKRQPSRDAPGR